MNNTFKGWWENLIVHPLLPQHESLLEIIKPDGSLGKKSDPISNIVLPVVSAPVDINKLSSQKRREYLFNTMIINKNIVDVNGRILVANIPKKINDIVSIMVRNKKRYEGVSHRFANPIRWYHIAMLHLMECNLSFNHYLGNGQPLNKITTMVPKGRGPFRIWEAGAIDAIEHQKLNLVQDWSIGNTLEMWERFNGWGYVLYHPEVNSPYLWSGTNHYTRGKYVENDRKSWFDKTVVSQQIGIAPVFKSLLDVI